MPSYLLDSNGLFYIKEQTQPECLISFWDYYANLGARPLHSFYKSAQPILPDILKRLFDCYGILAGEMRSDAGELGCVIALAALFRQSMRGYRPLHVLVTGDGRGVLTALLALAARETHPESVVYALLPERHDTAALGRLGEARANLKTLAGSLDIDMLRDRWFDMAFLSGEQLAYNAGMAAKLLRVVRPGGDLVCLTEGGAGLRDDILSLPGTAPGEYGVAEGQRVFIKPVAAGDYAEPPGPREMIREFLNALRDLVGDARDIPPLYLHYAASLLTAMEPHAIALFDMEDLGLKQRILEAKENILNCLYARDAAFRESQLERFRAFTEAEG